LQGLGCAIQELVLFTRPQLSCRSLLALYDFPGCIGSINAGFNDVDTINRHLIGSGIGPEKRNQQNNQHSCFSPMCLAVIWRERRSAKKTQLHPFIIRGATSGCRGSGRRHPELAPSCCIWAGSGSSPIKHRFACGTVGAPTAPRILARLKARAYQTFSERLAATPLSATVGVCTSALSSSLRDGSFLLPAKVDRQATPLKKLESRDR
jgi:hypothetical protein